ncbi:MAG: DMT family transporter, partial [Candidatus Roizmanbacteria bacterium]|nr:DMT family transporter [Candidatus Roizmanbacteria bacterium]
MSIKTRAVIALIIVASSYVFLTIASRLLNIGFEHFTQSFLRVFFGGLIASAVFYKKVNYKNFLKIQRTDIVGIFLMGVIGYGLFLYFITRGSLLASLINISVIYATLPFFTALYSALFLKKMPSVLQLVLTVISFIGVMIVSTKSFVPDLSLFGKGELFVLLAAACGAFYVVGRKFVSDRLNNYELSVVVMGTAALTTFILARLSGEGFAWNSFLIPDVLVGLVLGSGLNIVATFFENYSFKHLDSVFASQILLTENVFAFIFGYFLYRETVTLPEFVGASIIVVSVFIANRYGQT